MANSQRDIIKEIAGNLDCGEDCFYNPKSGEIVVIPNFIDELDEDELAEAFQADLDKIDQQKADFIKFEVLESTESFNIMERFVEQMTDLQFRSELEEVLQKKKPFQNFKYSIDNSSFRQKWFDFKQGELERIVESRLLSSD